MFLDLKKAFDTVNHQILLAKLEKYGIRGLPLQLLESYLNNRLQFTVVNNTKSKFNHVTCGVPQGSTLGPLLFLIYINDVPLVSNFNRKLCANDTVLILTNSCSRLLNKNVNSELVNFYFFYFISVFILLTCRKATEALIHRVGNYPDLLPEIPRYCCPLVI